MNNKGFYRIGGLKMEIDFEKEEDKDLIPSFRYFFYGDDMTECPDIKVSMEHMSYRKWSGIPQKVKTLNGSVMIYQYSNRVGCKVYDKQYRLQSVIEGNEKFNICRCEIKNSRGARSIALKTALLIIYMNAASFKNRMFIHSSTVKYEDRAYCFLGDSGAGKSTHSELWVENIPGSFVLNDDNPILQLRNDGKVMVWGSPWSGKTNYYIDDSAELGAMVLLSHGKINHIKRTMGIYSLRDLMLSSSNFPVGPLSYKRSVKNIIRVINSYPVYEMKCLPDAEAAIMCHDAVTHKNK